MKTLIIIGAGGHGKVCAEIAELSGKYSEIYFLDDNEAVDTCLKYKVIGKISDIDKYSSELFFVAIGNNDYRKKIIEEYNLNLVTLIHPSAIVSKYCIIEPGCVVMANSVLNADVTIGKGCIINTAATIDHDCCIGDFVHISPGVHLGGTCSVGQLTWIGIGSTVINNIDIEENRLVKAGSIIKKSIT